MEARFVALRRETHRIRDRLVDAGDAELPRVGAVGFGGKRSRVADLQTFGRRELPGDEDIGQLPCLGGSVRC